MSLLSQNSKIKKSGGEKYNVFNFGIPAYKTERSGKTFKTCPMAGKCAIGCYAQSGAYNFPNVVNAYQERLEATLTAKFGDLISAEIEVKLKTAQRTKKQLVIRIHDSGDFYNKTYYMKWYKLMLKYPNIKFYAYTKMVPMFKLLKKAKLIPNNFTIIFSEGGLADKLINTKTDRHARVFGSMKELKKAGYVNATENDLNAIGKNKKIGLVYHGYESKEWTTN